MQLLHLLSTVWSIAAVVIPFCHLCWSCLAPLSSSSSALLPRSPPAPMATAYLQRTFSLTSRKRGCHLITDEVLTNLSSDLSQLSVGLLHLFIQHTSASLTLNENYDAAVRADMEDALNRVAPEDAGYRHDDEGPDDMPAHVKASLVGSSVMVPITDGKLALGTWQGVWLCEHRDRGGSRRVVATMHGQLKGASTTSGDGKRERR